MIVTQDGRAALKAGLSITLLRKIQKRAGKMPALRKGKAVSDFSGAQFDRAASESGSYNRRNVGARAAIFSRSA
jgi:hypothetical protein